MEVWIKVKEVTKEPEVQGKLQVEWLILHPKICMFIGFQKNDIVGPIFDL